MWLLDPKLEKIAKPTGRGKLYDFRSSSSSDFLEHMLLMPGHNFRPSINRQTARDQKCCLLSRDADLG
ncbi:hypothetical protein EYF80_020089 [Liparis tanakae]|uniref:Uncharacterized protein n=1 Tax=Liparis tanakae TaxID=230148 RepID=A0A4Z2HWK9_9TELE|nr:hypothetical protein EYF80_020089 [Liparis tanakae]